VRANPRDAGMIQTTGPGGVQIIEAAAHAV
jgi:hypothetical protein